MNLKNRNLADGWMGGAPDLPLVSDAEVERSICSVPEHFSANLIVDLAGTALSLPSITAQGNPTSGGFASTSGGLVGGVADMGDADTFTNVMIGGVAAYGSGELRIAIQTSNTNTSGTFGDPTSGLAQLPTWFSSGGILYLNSGGLLGGLRGAPASGAYIQSGFIEFAGFQRPGEFARAIALGSGFYAGALQVSFVGQLRTTGSGGGYSWSPLSGVVNV